MAVSIEQQINKNLLLSFYQRNLLQTHFQTRQGLQHALANTLHMNIPYPIDLKHTRSRRGFLHLLLAKSHGPKQTRHTWIYLVLLSMSQNKHATHESLNRMGRNKHATHEYTLFFYPWAETNTLHINIPRSLICLLSNFYLNLLHGAKYLMLGAK